MKSRSALGLRAPLWGALSLAGLLQACFTPPSPPRIARVHVRLPWSNASGLRARGLTPLGSVPTEVASVTVVVSDPAKPSDPPLATATADASQSTLTLDVPAEAGGSIRTFAVTASDAGGTALWRGATTQVIYGGQDNTVPVDLWPTAAFAVVGVDPAAGQGDVVPTAPVSIYFSKSAATQAVSDATVYVADPSGGHVPVGYSFAAGQDDTVLVLTPVSPFAPATTYTVTVLTGLASADGQSLGAPFASSFTVVVPPSARVSSLAVGAARAVTAAGTATAGGRYGVASVEVSVDGGAWMPASGTSTWSFNFTAAAEGVVSVAARARDGAGDLGGASPAVTAFVDTTAPSVAIAQPPAGGIFGGSTLPLLLTGSASDGGSGVQSVQVSSDGGATWAAATGSIAWSYTWTPTGADGLYTLQARSQDVSGNLSSPVSVTVVVDRTAPVASIGAPQAGAILGGGTFPTNITGTAADAGSGVASVQVSLDGGTTWATASGTSAWSLPWNPLDGNYTLLVRAVDFASNLGATSSVAVRVDRTAPTLTMTNPLTGVFLGAAAFPLAMGGTAGDGGTGVASVQVSIDGGSTWTPATWLSPSWSFPWSPTGGDGPYLLFVRAADGAGNVATVSATVIVDRTAPSVSFSTPAPAALLSTASFPLTVAGSASDVGGSGVTAVAVSTDGGATWSTALGTTAWSFSWSAPGVDGPYVLVARAFDAAGNAGATTTVSVTVDTTPPSVTLTSPAPGSLLTAPSFPFPVAVTAADAGSGISSVQVSTDNGTSWSTASAGGSIWNFNWPLPATDGSYTLLARAFDGAGNAATSAAVVVTVDTAPPTVSLLSPSPGALLGSGAFPLTITGTSGDTGSGVVTVAVSTDGGATWSTALGTTSWSFSWGAPATDGAYALLARAFDNAGNVTTAAATAVTVDRTPPSASIGAPAPAALLGAGAFPVSITGTASDVGGSGVTAVAVSTNGGTTWTVASGTTSWSFVWTLPTDGSYSLVARAYDAAGNLGASSPVTITVDATPPNVGISFPTPGAFLGGSSFPLVVSGTAGDLGTGVTSVEVSTNAGASWTVAAGTGPWTFTWPTPGGPDGGYTLIARAHDGAGNTATTSVSVTVDTAPPTASILSPSPAALLGAASFPLAITGTAADAGSGVTAVAVSTDGGTTWSAASGTSSWTFLWSAPPDAPDTLVARAFDGAGNAASSPTVGVQVDRTPPSIGLNGTPGAIGPGSWPLTVSGTASDAGSGVVLAQVSSDGGATWSSALGTTSWSYAWSPTGSDGPYLVSARVQDAAGNFSGVASAVILVDTTPPAVSIGQPANGALLGSFPVSVTGTAVDLGSGVTSVDLSTDGGATWSVAAGTGAWTYAWSATPADGIYALVARAHDAVGNLATSSIVVNVDVAPPAVAITFPPPATILAASPITITGTDNNLPFAVTAVAVSIDGGATWASATESLGNWSFPWVVSGPDGAYAIVARAFAAGGSSATAFISVSVDRTPPGVSIGAPLAGALLSGASFPVAVTGTALDLGSGVTSVEISTNGGTSWSSPSGVTNWTYTWPTPGGPDGPYAVLARAYDGAGNTATASVSVTVDTTPPLVALTPPPSILGSGSFPLTITGTASDAGTGVTAVVFSIDGGVTWSGASGTTAWNFVWSAAIDGSHALVARVYDGAGNFAASATAGVQVDTTPPIIGIASPAPAALLGASSFPLVVSGTSSDLGTGVTSVEVSTDGGGTWSLASGTGAWTFSWPAPGGPDGPYTVMARAQDTAGNFATTSVSVTVDTTPPTVAFTAPPSILGSSSFPLTVSGTSSDAGTGVTAVAFSTDGGTTWSAATGATSWTFLWSAPPDGSYGLLARAYDAVGNAASSSAVPVTVDQTPPAVALSFPLPGALLSTAAFPLLVSGTASDAGSGVTSVVLSTDGGATWSSASGTSSWSDLWSGPATDGSAVLVARAFDGAGNVFTASPVVVTVDRTPPSAAFTSPLPGALLGAASFPFNVSGTASDLGTGVTAVEVSTNGGATWNPASGTAPWSFPWSAPGPDGPYTLAARAHDGAGNVSVPVTVGIQIDQTPPLSTVVVPNSPYVTASPVAQGTASDAGSGVQSVSVYFKDNFLGQWWNGSSWTSLPWLLPATGTTTWTEALPPLMNGENYTLTSVAVDFAGNQEIPSGGKTFTADFTPPVSLIGWPTNGMALGASTFPAFITGAASDSLSGVQEVDVSIDGGVTWNPASGTASWSFGWDPTGPDGIYTLGSRASDAAGNIETPSFITVTIDRTPPTVAILGPVSGSLFAASAFPVTVSGSASDVGTGVTAVVLSTDGGLTWTGVSGTASWFYPAWTPTGADGVYVLVALAFDGSGNTATSAVGVLVDRTPPSVSIGAPVTGALLGAAAFPYMVSGIASDLGSGVTQVQVSPDGGIDWYPASATSSWTYGWDPSGPDGTYTVAAEAIDAAGNLATATVSVAVDRTPPTVSILAPPPNALLGAAAFPVTVSGTADDPGSGIQLVEVSASPAAAAPATSLSVSGGNACASFSNESAQCWGYNVVGELGNGNTTNSFTPVPVVGITTATAVGTGGFHSCALLNSGAVECWGENSNGQLGDGSLTNSLSPVSVLGVTGASAIALGSYHTCALLSSGAVQCWGFNTDGELGNGSLVDSSVPVFVTGVTTAVGIAAGSDFTCAVLSSGGVQCWGKNAYGQLGNGSTTYSSTPVDVAGMTTASQVAAGLSHACTVLASGAAMCWGANTYGDLGDGGTAGSSIPVAVAGMTTAKAIAAGDNHSCAVLLSGAVQCWGLNGSGQLGNGGTVDSWTPTNVLGISAASTVAAGGDDSCALLGSGGVQCWGTNTSGQLGNGTNTGPNLCGGNACGTTPAWVNGLTGSTWFPASGTASWSYVWNITGPDGIYELAAGAHDGAGNISVATESVTVDETPPTATINYPPNASFINTASPLYNGSATDNLSGVQSVSFQLKNGSQWWNGAFWNPTLSILPALYSAGNWSYGAGPPLTDGQTYSVVQVCPVDLAGNACSGGSPVNSIFTVDISPPTSMILSPTNGTLLGASAFPVTIVGTSTDAISGVQMVQISTDGGVTRFLAVGTTNWSFPWNTTGPDGIYTIGVYALDTAGNVAAPTFITVTVDQTPPSPPSGLTALPGNGLVSLSWTPVAAPDLAAYVVSRSVVSGGPYSPLGTVPAPSTNYVDTGVINGTTYYYIVQAEDQAGNLSALSIEASATPNLAPPPTVAITAPVPGSLFNTPSYMIQGTAADAGGPGISTVAVSLEQVSSGLYWNGSSLVTGPVWLTASGTSSWSYYWMPVGPDGVYTFSAQAFDTGGLPSALAAVTATLDRTPPVSVLLSPGMGSIVTDGVAFFQGTATDNLSGVAVVQVALNGGPWATADGTSSWSFPWTIMTAGSAQVQTQAEDTAANWETPTSGTTVTFQQRVDRVVLTTVFDDVPLNLISGTPFRILGNAFGPVQGANIAEFWTDPSCSVNPFGSIGGLAWSTGALFAVAPAGTTGAQGLDLDVNGPVCTPLSVAPAAQSGTPTSSITTGAWSSIALDPTGYPAIAYDDQSVSPPNLRVARYGAVGTTVDTPDAFPLARGLSPSILTDDFGHLRVASIVSTTSSTDIEYAQATTQGWSVQVITSGANATQNVSMAYRAIDMGAAFSATMGPGPTLTPWTPQGPFQIVHGMAAVTAVVSGQAWVYLLGGESGPSLLPWVRKAPLNPDGSLGVESNESDMPVARRMPSAVSAAGYLYVLGGYAGSVQRAYVNPNGTLGPWLDVSPLPAARSAGIAFVQGSSLYYAGGYDAGGKPQGAAWKTSINPDGSLAPWALVASLNTPRAGAAIATFQNGPTFCVYAVGGLDSSRTPLASIEAWSSSTGSWNPLSTRLATARAYAGAGASNYNLFVAGGSSAMDHLQSSEVLSINVDPFCSLGSDVPASMLPVSLSGAGAVQTGTALTLLGGRGNAGNPHLVYGTPGGLAYASFYAGTWITSTIDPVTTFAKQIIIGPDGTLHVAYRDVANHLIKLATKPISGAWTIQFIDSAPAYTGKGDGVSLDVDASGTLHVSYFDTGACALRYVRCATATCSSPIVLDAGDGACAPAPSRIVSGASTLLANPMGVAANPGAAEIYAANVANNTVTVFPRTSAGNIAPSRYLQGPSTALSGPEGIAADPLNGELDVANNGSSSITVYGLTASGNSMPLRTISGALTGVSSPVGLAVDPVNNEIYATNWGNTSIVVHSRSGNGNVAPIRTISGPSTQLSQPSGVAVDLVNNEVFVANYSAASVAVFPRTASGNTTPLRFLSGSLTGLTFPFGVTVDPFNNELWVAVEGGGNGSVLVFQRSAAGNVAPLRVISGASTMLGQPRGIAVDPVNNEIEVANYGATSLLTFPRTARNTIAGAYPSLSVQPYPFGTTRVAVAYYSDDTARTGLTEVASSDAGSTWSPTPWVLDPLGLASPLSTTLDPLGRLRVSYQGYTGGPGQLRFYADP